MREVTVGALTFVCAVAARAATVPFVSQAPDAERRQEILTDMARERTRGASERSLTAWIRTGLALTTFGFGLPVAVHAISEARTVPMTQLVNVAYAVGIGYVALGIIAVVVAIVQYQQDVKEIISDTYHYRKKFPLGVAVAILIVVLGLASIAGLALTYQVDVLAR